MIKPYLIKHVNINSWYKFLYKFGIKLLYQILILIWNFVLNIIYKQIKKLP